jgi:hypothetical protein
MSSARVPERSELRRDELIRHGKVGVIDKAVARDPDGGDLCTVVER